MLTVLIVMSIYISFGVYCARVSYQKYRPSRVPLCDNPKHDAKDLKYVTVEYEMAYFHTRKCFGEMSDGTATWNAILTGMLWPPLLMIGSAEKILKGGEKKRPEERAFEEKKRRETAELELSKAEAELKAVTDKLRELED